jgi:hypothetical protein
MNVNMMAKITVRPATAKKPFGFRLSVRFIFRSSLCSFATARRMQPSRLFFVVLFDVT